MKRKSLKVMTPFGVINGTLGTFRFTTDRNGVVNISLINPLANRKQTEAQKIQNEAFGMIHQYALLYKDLLNSCYDSGKHRSGVQAFFSDNFRALQAALKDLAKKKYDGEVVSVDDIKLAVEHYATEHPKHIRFTNMTGYTDYYLDGEMPQQIVLTSTLDGTEVVVRNADSSVTKVYPLSEQNTTVVIPSGDSQPDQGSSSTGGSGTSGTGTQTGNQGGNNNQYDSGN